MKYCFEHKIILCRLGSHTSHKTQPLDVTVFGPLKTAYRELLAQRNRGDVNNVDKQYFTLLYHQARKLAFNPQNIKSGWSRTELYPFNPARVLDFIRRPQVDEIIPQTANTAADLPSPDDMLPTPGTHEGLTFLRTKLEQNTALGSPSKHHVQKLANATEKLFAERAILLDENSTLFNYNNEKTKRQSTRSTMIGSTKVASYEDILKAEQKRAAKEAIISGAKRGKRGLQNSTTGKRSRAEEMKHSKGEMEALDLGEYCSVFQI